MGLALRLFNLSLLCASALLAGAPPVPLALAAPKATYQHKMALDWMGYDAGVDKDVVVETFEFSMSRIAQDSEEPQCLKAELASASARPEKDKNPFELSTTEYRIRFPSADIAKLAKSLFANGSSYRLRAKIDHKNQERLMGAKEARMEEFMVADERTGRVVSLVEMLRDMKKRQADSLDAYRKVMAMLGKSTGETAHGETGSKGQGARAVGKNKGAYDDLAGSASRAPASAHEAANGI